MSVRGASWYFSDLLKVDAELKIKRIGKLTISNTSVFTSAKSVSAIGAIQQKHEGLLKCSVLPQGSHCPSPQQSYWCHQSAVSLSSVWPLCLGCIFWGLTFYSQSPLFMLYSLINFKLLPNRSSLPSFERSPFCAPEEPKTFTGCLCVPNGLGSIFIRVAHTCHDPGSYHFPPPHCVSCHCNFMRQGSPFPIHLYIA